MRVEEGGVMVKGRVTIDSRPPFRSVKEAVELFGERVLVGQIYGNQFKEVEPKEVGSFKKRSNITTTTTTSSCTLLATNNDDTIIISSELEETKKKLQKEREEGNHIATCIKTLQQELEQTRCELMQLKAYSKPHQSNNIDNSIIKQVAKIINPEIEELNYVENPLFNKLEFDDDDDEEEEEYNGTSSHSKKSVTFASPPSLTRQIMDDNDNLNNNNNNNNNNNVVVVNDDDDDGSFGKLGRSSSLRKEGNKVVKEGKKRTSNPIVGWIFPRKKKYSL